MTERPELPDLRAMVQAGHALVAEGRYAEAVRTFQRALPGLTQALGAAHPEVQELADDLEAARQMGEVAGFGRTHGFRGFAPPPPDDDA